MELMRSLLFVPGNRGDMLEKAGAVPADVLVPDLHNSVPGAEKERARQVIAASLPKLANGRQKLVPRLNPLHTGLTADDLAAVASPSLFGVTIGMVSTVAELRQLDAMLEHAEAKAGLAGGSLKLVLWIETALSLVNAYELCKASPRLVGVASAIEGFTVDMGVERSFVWEDEQVQEYYLLSRTAVAARAAGVQALDAACLIVGDGERLAKEAHRAKLLGYTGKFAIHPRQVEPINQLFTPSPQEVTYARRVLEAAAEGESQGRGATTLDGKLVDAPVIARARALLARAEAVERHRGGT